MILGIFFDAKNNQVIRFFKRCCRGRCLVLRCGQGSDFFDVSIITSRAYKPLSILKKLSIDKVL